jgi:hypothetical protein
MLEIKIGTIVKPHNTNTNKLGIVVDVQYDDRKCVKQVLIHWYDKEKPDGYKMWEFYNYFAKVS